MDRDAHLDGQAIHKQFIEKERSAEEIVHSCLKYIEAHDQEVGAYITLLSERALEQAKRLDKKRAQGEPLGRLAGIPISIKDNIHIEGEITTAASQFLTNYRAPFSATVIERLEQEDALLIGKTNLDEFAMGSANDNSSIKKTWNPWNLTHIPGGSSGGSAACVAARFTPIALGSDTGGSIRQPAALCGVVGYKPTYGRVSRSGLIAFGSSFDQIGPLTTSVADAALTMDVIAGHCPKDATSLTDRPALMIEETQSLQGRRIGVPWKLMEHVTGDVRTLFDQSIATLESLGAQTIEVSLDLIPYSIAVYYILANAEASTNLARFDGIRYGHRSQKAKTLDEVYDLSKQEGFGPEVKRRILLGTFVLSSGYQEAYYRKAQKVRTLMIEEFHRAFERCDAIALPTTPAPAWETGDLKRPLDVYLTDLFTIPANLAGLPAISLPSGFTPSGLPIGLQLTGPQRGDREVLQMAHVFETSTPWSQHLPPLVQKSFFDTET